MICSNCGTDNEREFKFCVKCGCSLVDPNEVNYEQVDMGGYHSEDEFSSQNSGYSIGSGTFTINDRSSGSSGSALYTADELNDTDEEFDFSMYEDLASAGQNSEPAAMPPQPAVSSTSPPPAAPPPMVVSQSIQPVMFPQPQIIGYDASGMPVYGQPAQPMIFPQLQAIGYDASGMPLYSQPAVPEAPVFPGSPAPAAQSVPTEQHTPTPPPPPQPPEPDEPDSSDSDFWKFFDGGSGYSGHQQPDNDDFFSRSGHVLSPYESSVGKLSSPDTGKIPDFMSDLPVPDSGSMELKEQRRPKMDYMSDTGIVNASELAVKDNTHSRDQMDETAQVDADKLQSHITMRSRYSMQSAGEADPDTIEAYVPKRSQAMMAQADHAVEAMPKKINPYESELDKIELPEYMKAKKTRHEETVEIPSLPGLE